MSVCEAVILAAFVGILVNLVEKYRFVGVEVHRQVQALKTTLLGCHSEKVDIVSVLKRPVPSESLQITQPISRVNVFEESGSVFQFYSFLVEFFKRVWHFCINSFY